MDDLVLDKNDKIADIVTNIKNNESASSVPLDDVMRYYNGGDYQKALDALKLLDPNQVKIDKNFYLGNCLYKLGNKSEAEMYWLKSVKESTKTPFACVNLGNFYYENKNFQKAVIYWHKALIIEPECECANLNLAIYYSKRECRDIAIHYYRKYMKYFHSNYSDETYHKVKEFLYKIDKYCEAFVQKAGYALEQKDYNKAVDFYLRAVYNNPCEPKITNFLGNMYFKARNYPRALQYHFLAYRNDPMHYTSIINIALAFDRMEVIDYAYCFYKRMLSLIPKNSTGYTSILSLMQKNKSTILGNKSFFNEHLRAAQEFEKDSMYQKAYEEYENAFIIMNSKEEEGILERMRTIKKYLDPELAIVSRLMDKLNNYFEQEDYEKSLPICNRIIALAKNTSQEYKEAYTKRNIAQRKLDPLNHEETQ